VFTVHILSQMNPIHTLPNYLFKTDWCFCFSGSVGYKVALLGWCVQYISNPVPIQDNTE